MDLTTIRNAKAGDECSIKKVMEKYSGIIDKVKYKYYAKGYDVEDFESIAMFGVWMGIKRFDSRGLKFYYNPETKKWRVCNKTLRMKFGACLKTNVYRYMARIWRAELKNVRKGEEVCIDNTNHFETEAYSTLEESSILNDMKSHLDAEELEVVSLSISGHTKREIMGMLNYSSATLRNHLSSIQQKLTIHGLLN